MTPIEILNKIILHQGRCSPFASADVCEMCPLSKQHASLKQPDLGCLELTGAIHAKTPMESDIIYLEAAKRKLIDLEVDLMLEITTDDIE